jgi:protein tyrosine phosphatase
LRQRRREKWISEQPSTAHENTAIVLLRYSSGGLSMVASQTVALRRLEVPPDVEGQVYLYRMPGRHENWAQFTAAAADARLHGIVCLVDDLEIDRKSRPYGMALKDGLPYALHRFPIADYGVPQSDEAFAAFVASMADRVRAGERLLVHCGAGIGRTGMFATCLLMALGCALPDALARTAAAGSHPETAEQRSLVERFATLQGA